MCKRQVALDELSATGDHVRPRSGGRWARQCAPSSASPLSCTSTRVHGYTDQYHEHGAKTPPQKRSTHDLTLIIVIIVVAALAMGVAGIYNNLVTLRNRVDNAWQNIDTQLQRRNDLVPNLVETVKGYAAHEKETLDAVTEARAAAGSAATPEEKMAADNVLTGACASCSWLPRLPRPQANANFTQLQTSLEDTENKISYARQSYNDCVLNYNNGIQTFPGNIFAGVFQFKPRTGFEAAEATREVPQVKF